MSQLQCVMQQLLRPMHPQALSRDLGRMEPVLERSGSSFCLLFPYVGVTLPLALCIACCLCFGAHLHVPHRLTAYNHYLHPFLKLLVVVIFARCRFSDALVTLLQLSSAPSFLFYSFFVIVGTCVSKYAALCDHSQNYKSRSWEIFYTGVECTVRCSPSCFNADMEWLVFIAAQS